MDLHYQWGERRDATSPCRMEIHRLHRPPSSLASLQLGEFETKERRKNYGLQPLDDKANALSDCSEDLSAPVAADGNLTTRVKFLKLANNVAQPRRTEHKRRLQARGAEFFCGAVWAGGPAKTNGAQTQATGTGSRVFLRRCVRRCSGSRSPQI
jgi:hypothetical protein